MPELLLELLSEEIPARMQAKAAADLRGLVSDALGQAGLSVTGAQSFATPRRLTLMIPDLAARTPDSREERRGPRLGAPDKALEGFLRSTGLSKDQLEIREEKKGAFYFAVIETPGRATGNLLADILPDILRTFPWPKSMRWGTGEGRWVRPLQSILCLFGEAVVPFEFGALTSGDTSRGHRFLGSQQPIRCFDFAHYRAKLLENKVILDPADRREAIRVEAETLASRHRLTLVDDPGLMDEVTGLVEWPVGLIGGFDPGFLTLPEEVIRLTLKTNQKVFTLRDKDTGALAPQFVVIANMQAADHGRAITAGNEKVIAARLADAKFFYDQDLKTPLADRLEALKAVTFHEKLGTVYERVERMEALALQIAETVIWPEDGPGASEGRSSPSIKPEDGIADRADFLAQVRRAARLAKADLTTEMVYEFPELQGVMGRTYALAQGEPAAVAQAIEQHYAPKGPEDPCPTAPVAVCVALAEKLDTLVGFFGIDEKPTGSKDPFALRRAALGVIRLILENGVRCPLSRIFEQTDLHLFFADRLKVQQREAGTRHDLIDAVFSLGGEDDLVRLLARVSALQAFMATEDGANLLAGYKRAANILRIEEKKDGQAADPQAVDFHLLHEPAEKRLYERLAAAGEARAAVELEDFADAMAVLASLRAPIDAFFDTVTVNAGEPRLRANRLSLLARFRASVHEVADFSKIEG